jgi:hypothetical protein
MSPEAIKAHQKQGKPSSQHEPGDRGGGRGVSITGPAGAFFPQQKQQKAGSLFDGVFNDSIISDHTASRSQSNATLPSCVGMGPQNTTTTTAAASATAGATTWRGKGKDRAAAEVGETGAGGSGASGTEGEEGEESHHSDNNDARDIFGMPLAGRLKTRFLRKRAARQQKKQQQQKKNIAVSDDSYRMPTVSILSFVFFVL